jgi:oxygen-dependent protoporphyrinogen oxidase
MLRGAAFSKKEALETALSHLREQLKLSFLPHFFEVHFALNAIPQYELGHKEKIAKLKERIKEKCPEIELYGNYLQGVSVNDCVALAKSLIDGKR